MVGREQGTRLSSIIETSIIYPIKRADAEKLILNVAYFVDARKFMRTISRINAENLLRCEWIYSLSPISRRREVVELPIVSSKTGELIEISGKSTSFQFKLSFKFAEVFYGLHIGIRAECSGDLKACNKFIELYAKELREHLKISPTMIPELPKAPAAKSEEVKAPLPVSPKAAPPAHSKVEAPPSPPPTPKAEAAPAPKPPTPEAREAAFDVDKLLETTNLSMLLIKAEYITSRELAAEWSFDNLVEVIEQNKSKFGDYQLILVTIKNQAQGVNIIVLLDKKGSFLGFQGTSTLGAEVISKELDKMKSLISLVRAIPVSLRIWGVKEIPPYLL